MRSALVVFCLALMISLSACSVAQNGRETYELPMSYDSAIMEVANRSTYLETLVGSRKWNEAKEEARILENLASHLNRLIPPSAIDNPKALEDYYDYVKDLTTAASLMKREVADHRIFHAADLMHDYAARLNRITKRFGPGESFTPTIRGDAVNAKW